LNISSYPLSAVYNSYQGGGYVYQMSWNQTQRLLDLSFLQTNDWIDRQTRAVFVEFNLFNPNINMFAYCYMLFEILPTGSIVKSVKFYPMTVFDSRNSLYSFSTVCAVIYFVMIFMLSLKQIYNIKIHKVKYFKRAWTYLDLTLIAFSLTSFAIWLYRVWEAQSIMSILSSNTNSTSTNNNKIVNLQMLAYWDDTLACMLSFCAALGTLKFLKLLSFNRSVNTLIKAFELGFADTAAFFSVFALTTFAWLQLGFVVFGQRVHDFSTFVKTIETGLSLILGKFKLAEMIETNAVWAIVFHITFNFGVVFIMFNLFLAILCDSLNVARNDDIMSDNLKVVEFVMKKVGSFYHLIVGKLPFMRNDVLEHERQMEMSLMNKGNYLDEISGFVLKLNQFVQKIDKYGESFTKEDNLHRQ
jgi:hypothetical protein